MRNVIAEILASITLCAVVCAYGEHYRADWESLDKRPCPEWFLDAKFGIFIHWGVYSVPAWGVRGEYAEWYWRRVLDPKATNQWREFHQRNFGTDFNYQDFAPQFRAELFDAEQWADLFVRSGARYVVPTSKHTDGFCLWPSTNANLSWGRPWNSVDIGPKRDLMQELSQVCRARGLRFGFYYCLYEWYNPLWLQDRKRYVAEHMLPQFKDVVSRYKPDLIFSDGEWDMPSADWRSAEFLAWLYNESACRDEVVVNDRWGNDSRHKRGNYFTTEYAAGLPDASHPWEENRGMGHSYGLNRAENLNDYRSGRELLFILIDTVSRGGNLLLNIGPAADGTIPVIMQERLVEIGDWLKVNGEAIYGTRYAGRSCQWTEGERPAQQYGEFMIKYDVMDQVGPQSRDGRAMKQVFFTQKGDVLYAILAGWPGEEIRLGGVNVSRNTQVTLLGRKESLRYHQRGGALVVRMPKLGPEELPCRDAYVVKITNANLEPAKP
jgi:alpha-L-fucosidase